MADVARRRRLAAALKLPSSTTSSSTKSWSTLGVPGACISNLLKRIFRFIRVFQRQRRIYVRCSFATSALQGGMMLTVGLIVGSTRPNRFADTPAKWLVEGASARSDLRLTVLDLRDFELPFFSEPGPPAYAQGVYTRPEAEAWRKRIGEFDAFVAVVAEYNHGPTAVLKNAFDSAFVEWQRKPIAFVGYGGVGGVRAIEPLGAVC